MLLLELDTERDELRATFIGANEYFRNHFMYPTNMINVALNYREPSTLQWVGGHYDPDAFDPKTIAFENPRKRWKIAFER